MIPAAAGRLGRAWRPKPVRMPDDGMDRVAPRIRNEADIRHPSAGASSVGSSRSGEGVPVAPTADLEGARRGWIWSVGEVQGAEMQLMGMFETR
jgi:hypothetical protein